MSKYPERSFRLYRYQINPTTKDIQGDYINGINSVSDLIEKKNDFFANAIKTIKGFTYNRALTTHKLFKANSDTLFIIRLAPNRPLKRTTKELVREEIDNWPELIIVIDNRPDKQYIAVELKQEAFRYTNTVANVLEANINKKLKPFQLYIQIEPLFEKHNFWDVVNQGKVDFVRFYINAPNLANLSSSLSDSLKDTIKKTNADRAHLGLYSPSDESLEISENNKEIEGLVDYASGGGGTVHVKLIGISTLYKTDDETKMISIDEACFEGDFDPEKIGEAFRSALNNV
ncbi:MAG: hypothetical protein PWQ55_2525 [Chloroflexota bacterium]|nr:hypothetical protein [Chloroflexota bacterium]